MTMNGKGQSRSTISLLMEAEAAGDLSIQDDNQVQCDQEPDAVAESPPVLEERAVLEIEQRLREQCMLVPDGMLDHVFLDDYRRIKRPLLANAFGSSSSLVDNGNLILVSSSIPGEGKTYTSINLALSIAQERDTSVLLIDCDMAKHGVSKALGVEQQPGMVDLLESDDYDLSKVIVQTDIPDLRVVPVGGEHSYATELVASQRMSRLMEEIAVRYDNRVIIIDGPPILPTPETQILTTLVGQVVFVVEAGKTPQSVVESAIDLISEDVALGIVLNKREGRQGHPGYTYGYYYGADD